MGQTHYCRCHHCGHITNAETGRVNRCAGCSKPIGQFYYFDDRTIAIYSDKNLRPEQYPGEVRPILGLTAYWESP